MKVFYKRNLPHFTPEGAVLFITSRLAGSLPQNFNANDITDTQLGKLLYNSPRIGRKKPSPYFLGDIMESLKRYTAFECNKILMRKGAFWQHENYDHVVRNREELIRITEYILNNPVKAGLCNTSEEWANNYYNPELFSV